MRRQAWEVWERGQALQREVQEAAAAREGGACLVLGQRWAPLAWVKDDAEDADRVRAFALGHRLLRTYAWAVAEQAALGRQVDRLGAPPVSAAGEVLRCLLKRLAWMRSDLRLWAVALLPCLERAGVLVPVRPPGTRVPAPTGRGALCRRGRGRGKSAQRTDRRRRRVGLRTSQVPEVAKA